MSAPAIEITFDSAKEILPILEEKLLRLDGHITSLQDEYDRTKATVAEIKMRMENKSLPFPVDDKERKRLAKGEAEGKIKSLLSGITNGGLTMQEIVNRAGVPYSSTFRILRKGGFKEENGKWKVEAS